MKKIFLAFVSAALLFCGCSEEKTEVPTAPDTITLSTDTILEGREGGTTEVTVTSSGTWRLAGACDWARPSAVSGANGETVVFTVDPNETYEDREATFKLFTGSAVAALRIVSNVGDILETESDDASVTIEHDHTSFTVKLLTNLAELESSFSGDGAEWIEFDERIDAFGATIMRYKTKANPLYENRSCTLTIRGTNTDAALEVPVTQRQIDVLEVNPSSFELDLSEQTIEVELKTNVPYRFRYSVNWISVVEGSGSATDTKIRLKVGKAQDMRSGTITLVNTFNTNMQREIKVIQNDPDAGNIQVPDEAFKTWLLNKNWMVAASGNEFTVTPTGKAATSIANNSPYSDSSKFTSLEGVEGFKNLTSISVYGNKLTRVDISKLTKVSSLNVDFNGIEEILLGDNPVESVAVSYHYHIPRYGAAAFIPSRMTVAGTKLKTLNIVNGATWYDELKTLDISGCPALETLKAGNRSKLKTIYMKTGQNVPNMEIPQGATIEYVD